MAMTLTNAAKQAAANRFGGGTKKLQARYLVLEDASGNRLLCSDTLSSVQEGATPPQVVLSGSATADRDTTYTTEVIIGDVGDYYIPDLVTAQSVVAMASGDFAHYVIATDAEAAGLPLAVTTGDRISVTGTVTF